MELIETGMFPVGSQVTYQLPRDERCAASLPGIFF